MRELMRLVCEVWALHRGRHASTDGGHAAPMPVAQVRRHLAGWDIAPQAGLIGGHRAAHSVASSSYGPRGRVAAEVLGRRRQNRVEVPHNGLSSIAAARVVDGTAVLDTRGSGQGSGLLVSAAESSSQLLMNT